MTALMFSPKTTGSMADACTLSRCGKAVLAPRRGLTAAQPSNVMALAVLDLGQRRGPISSAPPARDDERHQMAT